MQQVIQRDKFLWRTHAGTCLCLQTIHPADDPLIKIGIQTHRVVHAGAVLHQARQDLVNVIDGKSIISREIPYCTLWPRAPAIPGFTQGITLTHEHDEFSLRTSRNQHGNRLRFVKTSQVLKIAVRAEVIMHIIIALLLQRSRQDGNAALANHFQQLLATTLVFIKAHGWLRGSWNRDN